MVNNVDLMTPGKLYQKDGDTFQALAGDVRESLMDFERLWRWGPKNDTDIGQERHDALLTGKLRRIAVAIAPVASISPNAYRALVEAGMGRLKTKTHGWDDVLFFQAAVALSHYELKKGAADHFGIAISRIGASVMSLRKAPLQDKCPVQYAEERQALFQWFGDHWFAYGKSKGANGHSYLTALVARGEIPAVLNLATKAVLAGDAVSPKNTFMRNDQSIVAKPGLPEP